MMILDRRSFGGILLSAATALAAVPAFAQPAGPDPRRWVEGRLGAVSRLLSQGRDGGVAATEARDAQVARILNGMLDIEELGRRALDPYFGQQSPADQATFVSLLRQLIERNYRQNLESTLDWSVTYGAVDQRRRRQRGRCRPRRAPAPTPAPSP
jgi:ABC-type transporter MlaC component